MKQSSGFTLIEMLVTVVLLSALILIGSFSYAQFSKLWNVQVNDFDIKLEHARNSILINEVLDSLLPYVVYDANDEPSIYFEGNRNGFVGVSSKSLVSPGSFSVVRFSVDQNQDLTFRVLYEEWPMVDEVLRSIQQPINFIGPFVLNESVNDPMFDYFGWRSVEDKSPVNDSIEPSPPRWIENYNAVEKKFAPLKARFSYTVDAYSYQLVSNLASTKPALLAGYSGLLRKKSRSEDPDTEVWICAIEDC